MHAFLTRITTTCTIFFLGYAQKECDRGSNILYPKNNSRAKNIIWIDDDLTGGTSCQVGQH